MTIETKQTTLIRKNTLHNNCKKNEETKLVFCSSLLDIEEGFDNSLPSGYFSFSSYFVPQPVKLKFWYSRVCVPLNIAFNKFNPSNKKMNQKKQRECQQY